MSSPRLISCNVSSRSVALMASISPMAFATIGTQYLFELIESLLQLPHMANLPYHALKTKCLSESISLWERKFHHRNVLDKGGDPLDPVARMHETTNLLAPGNPISTAKDFFLKKRIKRRHCALDTSGCHGFRELFISAGTN